jgi:hypothetical protein
VTSRSSESSACRVQAGRIRRSESIYGRQISGNRPGTQPRRRKISLGWAGGGLPWLFVAADPGQGNHTDNHLASLEQRYGSETTCPKRGGELVKPVAKKGTRSGPCVLWLFRLSKVPLLYQRRLGC